MLIMSTLLLTEQMNDQQTALICFDDLFGQYLHHEEEKNLRMSSMHSCKERWTSERGPTAFSYTYLAEYNCTTIVKLAHGQAM